MQRCAVVHRVVRTVRLFWCTVPGALDGSARSMLAKVGGRLRRSAPKRGGA